MNKPVCVYICAACGHFAATVEKVVDNCEHCGAATIDWIIRKMPLRCVELIEEASMRAALDDKVERLRKSLPDIEIGVDPWNREVLTSAAVNQEVDHAEFQHSCVCCKDSALFVLPFVVREGVQIFSKPDSICVGAGEGVPADNWEARLRDARISEKVIQLVRVFFSKREEDRGEEEKEEEEKGGVR